jgi:hypothetical protein
MLILPYWHAGNCSRIAKRASASVSAPCILARIAMQKSGFLRHAGVCSRAGTSASASVLALGRLLPYGHLDVRYCLFLTPNFRLSHPPTFPKVLRILVRRHRRPPTPQPRPPSAGSKYVAQASSLHCANADNAAQASSLQSDTADHVAPASSLQRAKALG